MVGVTLPFSWKNFPMYIKLLDWVPRIFFRSLGVACSLYIDDHLNGELFSSEGFWSCPLSQRTPAYSYQSAEVEMYIVCTVLLNLGYFLDISKCALAPVTWIQHAGMIVEFIAQAFRIPKDKIKIAPLREQILWRQSTASLKSLQRLMGEMYFLLAGLSGGKILHLYIREMAMAIAKASKGGEVNLSPVLREEVVFWRFLDGWDKVIRWRSERHLAICFTSNASSFQWAAMTCLPSGTISVDDYWDEDIRDEHINVKGRWAVLEGL